ncbi:major facilitator superfamily domain-containing protein [Xylariales sp. PMI_506]|nr:major facilitator superfamily domain-containing protein [Xylariales sp. PMI_506]
MANMMGAEPGYSPDNYETNVHSQVPMNTYEAVVYDTKDEQETSYNVSPITYHARAHDNGDTNRELGVRANDQRPLNPREGVPRWRFICLVIVGCITGLVNGYDLSNVANIQATLFEAFGNIDLLPLVAIGYPLSQICVMPLTRNLSNFINTRALILFGMGTMSAGAIVSGSATSLQAVIVGRIVTGFGGGFYLQIAQQYLLSYCAPWEIATTQGLLGLMWVLGMLMGPLFGGLFAENQFATWRWAFYIIPIVVMGAAAPLVAFCTPESLIKTDDSLLERLSELDWVGFVLHCVFLTLFTIASTFSGSTWSWRSGSAIAAWIIWGLVAIFYFLQQGSSLFTSPEHRIIPVDSLTHPVVWRVFVASCLMTVSYSISLYYTPLFFAFTRGDSPIESAVHLLPFCGSFMGVVMIAGVLLSIVRRYAVVYLASGCLLLAASGYLVTINAATPTSTVLGLLALLGMGVGILFPVGISVMSFVLPKGENSKNSSDATLLNMISLSGTTLFTLGIAGSMWQNLGYKDLKQALAPFNLPDSEIRKTLAGVAATIDDANGAEIKALVAETMTRVLARLYYLVIAATVIMIIITCTMRWEALDFKAAKAAAAAQKEHAYGMTPLGAENVQNGPESHRVADQPTHYYYSGNNGSFSVVGGAIQTQNQTYDFVPHFEPGTAYLGMEHPHTAYPSSSSNGPNYGNGGI